jgi:fructose-1,6-bisphosphatase/inositol monophosphatase family enzyme
MTIPDQAELLALVLQLQAQIRDAVVAACERQALEELAGVAEDDEPGDTIYAVDRVSEAVLTAFFAEHVAPRWPLVLVGEGLPGGKLVLPEGITEEEATIQVIVDPIDGTRGLMYQKRPAWVLTGVAPNRGPATRLRDIELAAQTEIPLVKQHLCDTLWATAGGPVHAERLNRLTGERTPLHLRPSQAKTIAHGFAMVSRFFPGAREELAAIDEAVVRATLGPPQAGKAQCFEDQYISSGGQLYELIAGHDRFVADLRPLLDRHAAARGEALGICCHPYDLCTALIAERAGVLLTDERGGALDGPFDVDADVGWVGYANQVIREQIEPALLATLRDRGLLEEPLGRAGQAARKEDNGD